MNDSTRQPLVYKPHNKLRFVTAASLFDGHDASINIMRRILQATGCEVIHLGPQPLGRGDRRLRAAGGRAGHRDLVLPGRARRVLQVHARPVTRARRRTHQGVRRRRRRHRACGDPRAARVRRRAHLLARGRPEARVAGHDQRDRRGRRRRPRRNRRPRRSTPWRPTIATCARGPWRGPSRCWKTGTHRRRCVNRCSRAAGAIEGPGARHHRYRRRRQELADRRAGAALPPRPGRRG